MGALVVFNDPGNPNRWRPFEKECLEAKLGRVAECGPEVLSMVEQPSIVLWRLSAEKTRADQLQQCVEAERAWWGIPQVNRPTGWLSAHAKDHAFAVWNKFGVPTTEWGYVRSVGELIALEKKLPVLVRINYANTGDGTKLCRTPADLVAAWSAAPAWYVESEVRYGPGVARNLIWTKFIDHARDGLRYSYRVIVCCGKVVTAYARTCPADSWLAITSKFRKEDGPTWLQLNRECRAFCSKHEAEIVRAVESLGLSWQGVDIIFDDGGRPYFLEVQPDYSAGNPRYGDKPPWYNPSYPVLVSFLQDNMRQLQMEIPDYVSLWLDKKGHFSACADLVDRYMRGVC